MSLQETAMTIAIIESKVTVQKVQLCRSGCILQTSESWDAHFGRGDALLIRQICGGSLQTSNGEFSDVTFRASLFPETDFSDVDLSDITFLNVIF